MHSFSSYLNIARLKIGSELGMKGGDNLNLDQAFELYCKDVNPGTLSTHENKIREYLEIAKKLDFEQAFDREILSSYIFKGDKSALGKYSALVHFYNYIYIEILQLPKQRIHFPIYKEDVKNFDSLHGPYETARLNKKGDRVFLERDFQFSELFNDKYYYHLNNDIALKTVKAAIALGIGAGYDSGEMFINNTIPQLKLADPIITDTIVRVKNYYPNTTIPYIDIHGNLADYIRDYYWIRNNQSNVTLEEKELYFAKLWDTFELKYNPNIQKRKPYKVQELVYYMLKYISVQKNLESYLTVTDLRSNLVLHSLYNSKGASLKQIIKTFGFVPFVQEAFEKYCEHDYEESSSLFYDSSFFPSSPSGDIDEKEEHTLDGEVKRRGMLINKLLRDNRNVKKLKAKYDNICQICGFPLTLINDISYSEACHIQPLGGEHKGVDLEENMLILCPNHHKLFDLGFISIDPETLDTTLCIDAYNPIHNAKLKVLKHKLSPISVRYHYENIFLPLVNEIYGM